MSLWLSVLLYMQTDSSLFLIFCKKKTKQKQKQTKKTWKNGHSIISKLLKCVSLLKCVRFDQCFESCMCTYRLSNYFVGLAVSFILYITSRSHINFDKVYSTHKLLPIFLHWSAMLTCDLITFRELTTCCHRSMQVMVLTKGIMPSYDDWRWSSNGKGRSLRKRCSLFWRKET